MTDVHILDFWAFKERLKHLKDYLIYELSDFWIRIYEATIEPGRT